MLTGQFPTSKVNEQVQKACTQDHENCKDVWHDYIIGACPISHCLGQTNCIHLRCVVAIHSITAAKKQLKHEVQSRVRDGVLLTKMSILH